MFGLVGLRGSPERLRKNNAGRSNVFKGTRNVFGGLVGGPCACQDQFRGFKSHRVHARRVFFSLKNIDLRKAPERELATFDQNRLAVGILNPKRDERYRHIPGGRRHDTCDHGLSRRALRVQTSDQLGLKVNVMTKNK